MVHRCQEVQAADLVLVQGGQFLAASEPVLDLPPGPGDLHSWANGTGRGAWAR